MKKSGDDDDAEEVADGPEKCEPTFAKPNMTQGEFGEYYLLFTEPVVFFLMMGLLIGLVAWLNQHVFRQHTILKLLSIFRFMLLSGIYLLSLCVLEWSRLDLNDCALEGLKSPEKSYLMITTRLCFHWIIIGIISVILALISSRKYKIENKVVSCIAVLLTSGTIALYYVAKQAYARDSLYNTEALGFEKQHWVLDIFYSKMPLHSAANVTSSWFIVKVLYHCDTAEVTSAEDDTDNYRAANIYQVVNVHFFKPLGVLAAQLFLGFLWICYDRR